MTDVFVSCARSTQELAQRVARLDRSMELWEYGPMRTTLELPDSLMRRVRLRAVHRGQKLKDAVAQLLELGFAADGEPSPEPRAPQPVRLKGGRLTLSDIEDAIAGGRD